MSNFYIVYLTYLAISLVFTFGYLFTWIKFQNYQFLERDYNIVVRHKEYSKRWHFWKGFNNIIFFSLLWFAFSRHIAFINVAFYWIFFDGLLNKMVLNRPFFYIGQTAFIDKIFHNSSEWFNTLWISRVIKVKANPYIISGCMKLLLMFLSIRIIF